MSTSVIKHLVLKDWQLTGKTLLLFLSLAGVSVWLLSIQHKGAFYAGSVIMLSMVIIAGAYLVITTVTTEKSEQNLPFILTLPVNFMQYNHAKIIANMTAFLLFWGLVLLAVLWVIFSQTNIPDGMVVFTVILLLEMLVVFVLILAVGLVTASQSWTIVVITITNIGLSLFMYWLSSLDAIRAHMDGSEVVWNSTALTIVASELLLIVLLLLLTYVVQASKKDFI